ncbi:Early girl [Operophtera brumata]|uniref:E3 ubiquitin-protein ligase NRDP1 n=1 Tax=Operophtera brumata TaxID=104452 RepID=A0A0L7LFW6_OPEBR|nr:Early girl [Operophtera brumata]
MGFDIKRFQGDVDEELICPICSGVLEDPLQAPACEHAFCRACITEWISRQPTCPVDRQAVTASQLRPVPRILRNLLSRLCTTCDNQPHGSGCGLVIPKDELAQHNCVRELRALIATQQGKLTDYQHELAEQRLVINEHKRELALLKEFMRAMRVSNPAMRALADQMEREEVVRWANSLSRARVTRWGGMISTPDEVLQQMIKRSLSESGCPPHIIDDLMENCHERRWPPGLSSLETRQNNRRQYEKYVCKRVPGKQAVLVLQCDNGHVDEHMMVEPGLVMIFAHGIE